MTGNKLPWGGCGNAARVFTLRRRKPVGCLLSCLTLRQLPWREGQRTVTRLHLPSKSEATHASRSARHSPAFSEAYPYQSLSMAPSTPGLMP
jgi:hypothetical protein